MDKDEWEGFFGILKNTDVCDKIGKGREAHVLITF